jgi:hypothetical protein
MWHGENYVGECDGFACPHCKKSIETVARHTGDDIITLYIGKTITEIETAIKKEEDE